MFPRRGVTVLNHDIAPPAAQVTGNGDAVPRQGPLTIKFDEDVVGVDAENTVVHVGAASSNSTAPQKGPAPIAGTWACQDVARAVVDCSTGPVRTAAFTPALPWQAHTRHTLEFNPEHQLGVTDLAGNPYRDPYSEGSLEFTTN